MKREVSVFYQRIASTQSDVIKLRLRIVVLVFELLISAIISLIGKQISNNDIIQKRFHTLCLPI